MFRKLFIIMVAVLLVSGTAFGAVNSVPKPGADNVIYQESTGSSFVDPPVVVVRVRYAKRGGGGIGGLNSGDVVVWDIVSGDGLTISACTSVTTVSYAGVLVTDIQSADNNSVTGNERNWGYMAIHGYCLARVDTTEATTGETLVPNGENLSASFRTQLSISAVSNDIGVLLSDTGVDGLMPVWLR